MELVKTDLDGFYRDPTSKAVINMNVEKINQYKQQRDERMKLQTVVNDVESLKQDISDIKELLINLSKRV